MVSQDVLTAYAYHGLTLVSNLLPSAGNNVRTNGTAGCTKPHPVDGLSRNFTISTDGGYREYRLHLPSSYNANTPNPLVISYHGHGQNMVEQETLSQFSNDKINPKMIAVYPQGLEGAVSRATCVFPAIHLPREDILGLY